MPRGGRGLIGAGWLVLTSLIVIALAVPAQAAPAAFGAKLTRSSQPTGPERCDQSAGISDGAKCTWVATTAFENGDHFVAPKDGTITKVQLVSCVGGAFRLQIARVNAARTKAKVVRNGPTIDYAPDPRQVDGNPDTFCGGNDGNDYIVQSFTVNVAVHQGDYIAAKAKRLGFLHNSGGGNTLLFDPPLVPGGPFTPKDGESSADLMLRLIYG